MSRAADAREFETAIQLLRAGRLPEVERLCRQITARSPRHAGAIHLLAIVAFQTGRAADAIPLVKRAIQISPEISEFHLTLGSAYATLGKLDDAIAAFRRTIATRPNDQGAWANLSAALFQQGKLEEAIAAARKALSIKSDDPDVWRTLAGALYAAKRQAESIDAWRHVLALQPNDPDAHNNLGINLKETGRLDEAIPEYQRALAIQPTHAPAWNNLAIALNIVGRLPESLAALRKVGALRPDLPEVQNNLGNALQRDGQLDEAVAAYHRAIAARPDYAEAFDNLGNTLAKAGRIEEAIPNWRRAAALDPRAFGNSFLYPIHFHPDYSPRQIFEEHDRWRREVAEALAPAAPSYTNSRDPERRLKVAYVSPDFGDHPVGRFIIPLLREHDRTRVEIVCYSDVPVPDARTERIKSLADVWRSIVGLPDERFAQLVRDDQIDILIDLTLHSGNNRMLTFARRPAPVQATWLAYCSTSGLRTMDYRLTDPYFDPPGIDETVHSERSIRLPRTWWCYEPVADTPDIGPTPAEAAGHVTFGCLNNFSKVSRLTMELWARIMNAVPGSRLLLHAFPGSPRQLTSEIFQQHGIDASRLEFAGRIAFREYAQQYNRIDIALDPCPFAGGTTSCDALWMGVPLVTLAGATAVSRAGASILSNISVPELITHSPDEYVQLATDLAKDLPRLATLRGSLRERMRTSPLMDAPQFARDMEAAFRQMWHAWCGRGNA